ncbi:MAG: HIT domain-containing protein [Actinomycetota bacterium]|nr:HIT domain-containing protein [Actinomycetota bacterium]
MAEQDCLFCAIVAGDLPAEKIDEDEHTIAFMDINPWTRGHALVIPRCHTPNLYEIDDDDLRHTAVAARRLARRMRERLGCDGINVLNAAEPAAWQSVFHFHLHVIPRYHNDSMVLPVRPRQAEAEELASVARELRG